MNNKIIIIFRVDLYEINYTYQTDCKITKKNRKSNEAHGNTYIINT